MDNLTSVYVLSSKLNGPVLSFPASPQDPVIVDLHFSCIGVPLGQQGWPSANDTAEGLTIYGGGYAFLSEILNQPRGASGPCEIPAHQ